MIETELDVLRDITQRLEGAQIAFMLTGSMAMNYYAQPRMTRDIDLVIELDGEQVESIFQLFEADYYVDKTSISRAIALRSMFNVIHNEAIIKVDCVVLKNSDYRREEFARRRKVKFGDFETWIVSREDLILSKLVWASATSSEMQLRDVRSLLSADCDFKYLREQAKSLNVDETLRALQNNE